MIEQIQNSSNLVQKAMNESKDKANSCVENTEIANEALGNISNAVKDIMDRNIQIAAAIEEQSVVIEEINKNTTHINDISVQVGDFSTQQFNTNEILVDEVNQQQVLFRKSLLSNHRPCKHFVFLPVLNLPFKTVIELTHKCVSMTFFKLIISIVHFLDIKSNG